MDFRKYMTRIPAFLIFCTTLLLCYCTEDDGLTPLNDEAFVNARFFNVDSLVKVNQTITELDSVILLYNDSISVARDSVENGNADYEPILADYRATRDQLRNNKTGLEGVRTQLQNGVLKIQQITGPGTEKTLLFGDSTNRYRLPLNANQNFSTFYIQKEERADTVTLFYDMEFDIRERVIGKRAFLNIENFQHTYDSINFSCIDPECISNGATIRFYY